MHSVVDSLFSSLLFRRPYMVMASVLHRHLLESIPSTPLNGFYETLTHDVNRSAIEHCEEIFGYRSPSNKWGPKTTYFRRLYNSVVTLRANISDEEHDIDNRDTALKTTKGLVHRPEISWTSGPLAAENRTVVFTHLPKSSSAWRRRPSRWPAVRSSCSISVLLHFVLPSQLGSMYGVRLA